jgi:hypothetical protein
MREGIPGPPDLVEVRQRRTEAVKLDTEAVAIKEREGRGATGVVLTVAFWLVAITLILETAAGCSPAPSAATPSLNPPVSVLLKAGDNVTLDQGGGATLVAVATTAANLDEWTKSAIANDTLGQKQMLSDGRVFAVDRGTSALIIDIGWTGIAQCASIRVTTMAKVDGSQWSMERSSLRIRCLSRICLLKRCPVTQYRLPVRRV